MSAGPAVRRIVLYKQGIAHIERRGSVQGGFDLLVDRAELGEVLRSLTVWVERGGGHMTALAFDAPEDPDAALAGRKLRFEPGATLRGMLHATRGRRVRIESSEGSAEGELLGFEESTSPQGARRWLLLRTGLGQIAVFDLAAIRTLDFVDAAVRGSLDMLVDRSRASARGDGRSVHVVLDGAADDVRVLYVVPSTPFVISYRLACGPSDARFFAFALIHNPLEEDLERVEFVLSSKAPTQVGSAQGPAGTRANELVKHERTRRRASGQPNTVRAPVPQPTVNVITPGKTLPPKTSERTSESNESNASSIDLETSSTTQPEATEWRASDPVSLRRRSAAMVPVFTTTVSIRKERVFRDAAGVHPDLLVCFDNLTSSVLEEGRCAVYDLGRYLGEATLPQTAPGASAKLSFAKDQSVRRSRTSHKTSFVASLDFKPEGVDEQESFEERHFVTIRSDHQVDIDVVVDIARVEGRTIVAEGHTPIAETAASQSFRLQVPALGEATLSVCESWKQARRVPYDGLELTQVEGWRRSGLLDEEQHETLIGMLRAWEDARSADTQWARLEREMLDLFSRQSKITDQLGVLHEGGPEGMLRMRFVSELDSAQHRILAIDEEMQKLRARASTHRQSAQQALTSLSRP
ncbi:MAG: hypothetical protein IPM54_17190 [Polyangiaceae bacterium]|nr:hypothetical protein [Polyangiaceae bacterium]